MHVSRLQKTEGELLTIIEASISDKVQREAVKSLVRNCIGELWCFAEHAKLPEDSLESGTSTYQKWLRKQPELVVTPLKTGKWNGSTSGGNNSPLPEGEIKIIS